MLDTMHFLSAACYISQLLNMKVRQNLRVWTKTKQIFFFCRWLFLLIIPGCFENFLYHLEKKHYKPCCTSDQTLPAQTPIVWTLHCVGVERRLQWFTSSWLSKTRLCTNNNTGVEKMCQIGFGYLSVVGQNALSFCVFLGIKVVLAQDSCMTFNFVRSKTWLCFFSMLEWSFLLHQTVLCQRLNVSAFLFGPACVRLSCLACFAFIVHVLTLFGLLRVFVWLLLL